MLAAVDEAGGRAVGPELLWSESFSALHELARRGELDQEDVTEALALVQTAPIEVRRPRALRERAWEIADRLGWVKTYDAEYCALAELLGYRLLTTDRRLRAAADRLGYVLTLDEAASA